MRVLSDWLFLLLLCDVCWYLIMSWSLGANSFSKLGISSLILPWSTSWNGGSVNWHLRLLLYSWGNQDLSKIENATVAKKKKNKETLYIKVLIYAVYFYKCTNQKMKKKKIMHISVWRKAKRRESSSCKRQHLLPLQQIYSSSRPSKEQ